MEHSKDLLREDLIKLGIKKGDSLIMHSSFKSLGGIEGGAEGFYEVLTDIIGNDGNLIIPTLSYNNVNEKNPVYFDVNSTQSCVGYMTEYFRTNVDGVKRSLHATHSCAVWGHDREYLIAGHENDVTPVGENSPIRKLQYLNGKILIMGSHPDHNTSMHGVEETVEVKPFIDFENKVKYYITDYNNKTIEIESYQHNFERNNGIFDQCYSRILQILDKDNYNYGKILDAASYLIDADALWKKGHDKLAIDPYFFVSFRPYKK